MAPLAACTSAMDATFDFESIVGACVPSIEEIYADQAAGVARWRKERLQALREELDRAAREVARERASAGNMFSELAGSQSLKQEASARHEVLAYARDVARENAAACSRRSEAAARSRDEFFEVRRQRLSQLEAEEKRRGEAEAEMAARIAEVEGLRGAYADRLGLAVSRVGPGTVRMTFTLVDTERPEAEFSFTLGLGAGGASYSAGDYQPALPAEQVQALEQRLNPTELGRDAMLPAFLVRVRGAFKELVAASRCGRPETQ